MSFCNDVSNLLKMSLLPADAVVFWFCLFLCMVTDFLAAEKGRGVKFCMRVGLLSGQVFFPLVTFSSRGVRGAAALLPG